MLLLLLLLLWQVYLASFYKVHQTLRFYANSLIAFYNNQSSPNNTDKINRMHRRTKTLKRKTSPGQLAIMLGISLL